MKHIKVYNFDITFKNRNLYDHLNESVLILNDKLEVIYSNLSFRTLAPNSRIKKKKKLKSYQCYFKIHGEYCEVFDTCLDSGKAINIREVTGENNDGKKLSLTLGVRPLVDHEKKAVALLVSIQDKSDELQAHLKFKENIKNLEEIVDRKTVELRHSLNEVVLKNKELIQTQQKLIQAEKIASLSQIAGGMAHEINTPVQYINDNLSFLKEAFSDLLGIVGGSVNKTKEQDIDNELCFFKDEIPTAILQSQKGLKHIHKFILSMNTFSHEICDEMVLVNLNKLIQDIVGQFHNEYIDIAWINLKLSQSIPRVYCFEKQIHLTFENLLTNAFDAIKEKQKIKGGKGVISISTNHINDLVEIHIQDSGVGISSDIIEKIYDPFYTTKELGKGIGQGLCIAYKVITENHLGSIKVESTDENGTVFCVQIPRKKVS